MKLTIVDLPSSWTLPIDQVVDLSLYKKDSKRILHGVFCRHQWQCLMCRPEPPQFEELDAMERAIRGMAEAPKLPMRSMTEERNISG